MRIMKQRHTRLIQRDGSRRDGNGSHTAAEASADLLRQGGKIRHLVRGICASNMGNENMLGAAQSIKQAKRKTDALPP